MTLVVNIVVSHAYSAHIGTAATNVLYSVWAFLTIQCLLMIKFFYLSVWFLLKNYIINKIMIGSIQSKIFTWAHRMECE